MCPKIRYNFGTCRIKNGLSSCVAQKSQIATLVAILVSGQIILLMHIFPGQQFVYNPLEGGVEGAYFGLSSNRWIKIELFYSWIKIHFSVCVGHQ